MKNTINDPNVSGKLADSDKKALEDEAEEALQWLSTNQLHPPCVASSLCGVAQGQRYGDDLALCPNTVVVQDSSPKRVVISKSVR